ncbi:MAG: type transport system ATP-binding protein [Acidimicrobiaceae bacterium]|jgi:ABC-2 type transport system ATP-binding protein
MSSRTPADGAAVTADGLARRYEPDVWALRDLGFRIEYASVFALLGRNGSGKTTAVRILTTLTRASSGFARVAGFDIARQAREVRAAIGVTMQAAALDPEMTGREHLELICGAWGDVRTAARRHANALLEEMGLTAAADRLIRTYSGGMQRRLDLAGALAHRPRVLFLDEPTTGLDAQSRRLVWSRVQEVRESGVAVLLTTQYLEEADQLADVVAVLDDGRIVATGTPTELKTRFSTTTVRVRSGDASVLAQTAVDLSAFGLDPRSESGGWLSVDVDSAAAAMHAVYALRERSGGIDEVSVASPSLEDAYLALTGQGVERSADDTIGSVA